jgi:hypothetical protein
VSTSGHLVDPQARGFDKQLDACVTAAMARWTIPVALVDDEPIEAHFDLTLELAPAP